ncbi:hypothetical protein N9L48_05005 [Psychrosphaera sp.]|nr:hypothetical protein [Psychrosphaera sp.]
MKFFLSLNSLGIIAFLFSASAVASTSTDWPEDNWGDDPWAKKAETSWSNIASFVEVAFGQRLSDDPVIKQDSTLNEIRIQTQADYKLKASTIKLRGQVFYDGVQSKWRGQIRELNWQGKVNDRWDVKAGQQILTWGTGDYLFLNDMFAKDWQSFFAGRDNEYLKAPQLAVKASGYYDFANVDLVVTPTFVPDQYINGDVFSFYNPIAGQFNGGQNVAPGFDVSDQNKPNDAEFALRIKKQYEAIEFALYGYKGFDKSPNSLTPDFQPRFTKLNVVGASMVTPMFSGLFNFEVAQHNTADGNGQNPLIPNSESKLLVGYQQELVTNLTGSVQFQLEHKNDFHQALSLSPEEKQNRTLWTAQLYYRLMQDTLSLQWFTFYSPSDNDGYSRFKTTYQPIQNWQLTAGINYFWGKQKTTFFGQFEDASNGYLSIRKYF